MSSRFSSGVAPVTPIEQTCRVQPPDVSYARSGDVAIAYQVVGDGSPDIVWVRGIAGDLLSTWDQPLIVRHAEGLAACGRLLMLDKRGTGLFAGLALFDPSVKGVRSADYPWAPTEDEWRERTCRRTRRLRERRYLEELAREWAPEVADNDAFRDWFVWHMRRSLSPGAALTSFRARAVRAATAIRDSLRELGLEIRAGVHTGECEVSNGKVAGVAVSIGARISSLDSWRVFAVAS
jgi:hypothetical protein